MLATALKFISAYRVLFIVGGLVGAFILNQQFKIWNSERKLTNAIEKITKLNKEAKEAKDANKTTHESLTACLLENQELTRQGDFVQAENDKAIRDINDYADLQDKKIIDLQSKIKPDTNCSLEYVSDNTVKLFKQAINQD